MKVFAEIYTRGLLRYVPFLLQSLHRETLVLEPETVCSPQAGGHKNSLQAEEGKQLTGPGAPSIKKPNYLARAVCQLTFDKLKVGMFSRLAIFPQKYTNLM